MEKISGIYKITNNITNKFYIGSSDDIYKRWYHHKRTLNNGTHANRYLQASWNKYGSEAFEFGIIEQCEESELLKKEQNYIEEYYNSGILYNIAKFASAPMKGRHHSEESKRKFSEYRKGRHAGVNNPMYGKHLSEETKKKLSERFSGENNPMYGKTLSEETKRKISEANTGNKCPEYLKRKFRLQMLGIGNPFYGKKHTKESLKLMSKNRTGLLKGAESPVSKKVVRISPNGEERVFDTVTQAAKESHAQRSHIALVCRGERNQAGGYKWRYL